MTTKTELAIGIAEQFNITKKMAGEIVDSLLAGISKSLANGETVPFIGFGTFSVKDRAAREGKNPQTGEAIKIAARKVPHFKAGTKLKEAVN